MTHCDLTNSKAFVLVLACAPFDRRDESLPNALHKLGIGKGLFTLARLDSSDNLAVRVVVDEHLADRRYDTLLEGGILALCPPLCYLREPRRAEMLVEGLVVAFVWREEGKKVPHATLA